MCVRVCDICLHFLLSPFSILVLAANAGPLVPSGGVTHKRRCTYRPSVIYLIVNTLFSLPPPSPFRLPLTVSPGYGVQVAFSCRPLPPGKLRLQLNATAIEDTQFNVWRRAMDPTP